MSIRHVTKAETLMDRKLLDHLFGLARKMEKMGKRNKLHQALRGKILATIFYEPSTRTRLSFEAGMIKLGGGVISVENAVQASSASKGESLEDAVRVVSSFADVIVLRHPDKGAAQAAAEMSRVPVINAGDGSGEHPTQALYDLYTIHKEHKSLDGLSIALVGDLLNGRTVHSLLQFIPLYRDVKLILVAPKKLQLPKRYVNYLKQKRVKFEQVSELAPVLKKLDVLYMTRIQKERFASRKEYEAIKNVYVLDGYSLTVMKKDAVIMHPLPRVQEITVSVDRDPRAAYFRQAENGLYARMALLYWILKGK